MGAGTSRVLTVLFLVEIFEMQVHCRNTWTVHEGRSSYFEIIIELNKIIILYMYIYI